MYDSGLCFFLAIFSDHYELHFLYLYIAIAANKQNQPTPAPPPPKLSGLKLHTFIISEFLWFRSLGMAELYTLYSGYLMKHNEGVGKDWGYHRRLNREGICF